MKDVPLLHLIEILPFQLEKFPLSRTHLGAFPLQMNNHDVNIHMYESICGHIR